MRGRDTDDIARHGGVPIDVIQSTCNFHYSVGLDLSGGETSTNVANYFSSGLEGRWQEDRRSATTCSRPRCHHRQPDGDRIVGTELLALTALDHDLRTAYVGTAGPGVPGGTGS